ncbi:hypothetical protein V1509DRAFT_608407 [Lipomyces kononenkoae]
MHDAATHSFLAQIPLIISPFLKLPQPVALPLNYASLPRGLPPSSTARLNDVKAVAVSVEEQQRLVTERQNKAKDKVTQWESDVLRQETIQQRRIAPGYLDTDVHILHPIHPGSSQSGESMSSYATAQPFQQTPFYDSSADQLSAVTATSSLPVYASLNNELPPSASFEYGQQQLVATHPYASSMASSAASSTPSLNGYNTALSSQYAPARSVPPPLQAMTYPSESSTYQEQHSRTYDVPSYRNQPSTSSRRSSPVAQPTPSLSRQPSVALPVRTGTPSPPGPPLPPRPPAEFVNRPLRISSMRKPLVSEYPWSSTASFAARTFSGLAGGKSTPDSKYIVPQSSSTRTDTSSLYEGAPFRRSSLPRLDSYRARDTGYNSLDAKLSEYLDSSKAANTADYRLPYSTEARTNYSLSPEQSSYELVGDRNTTLESAGLIDLEGDDLVPSQTPGPAAPSLAAPITNSFSVPGTMTSSSSTRALNFPDYLSDDNTTFSASESAIASQNAQDDPYASGSHFKLSANYLDNDRENSDTSNMDDVYSQPMIKPPTTDSEDDNDFSILTHRQGTTFPHARAEDIETPVDESEIDYNPVSVMEESAAAEKTEEFHRNEPGYDDAKIEEMLRQLQEEIDMEEKAAARAKREARRQALEAADDGIAAEQEGLSEAEVPTQQGIPSEVDAGKRVYEAVDEPNVPETINESSAERAPPHVIDMSSAERAPPDVIDVTEARMTEHGQYEDEGGSLGDEAESPLNGSTFEDISSLNHSFRGSIASEEGAEQVNRLGRSEQHVAVEFVGNGLLAKEEDENAIEGDEREPELKQSSESDLSARLVTATGKDTISMDIDGNGVEVAGMKNEVFTDTDTLAPLEEQPAQQACSENVEAENEGDQTLECTTERRVPAPCVDEPPTTTVTTSSAPPSVLDSDPDPESAVGEPVPLLDTPGFAIETTATNDTIVKDEATVSANRPMKDVEEPAVSDSDNFTCAEVDSSDPPAVDNFHESDAEPANYPDSMQDPSAVGDHESDAEPASFPDSMQDASAVSDHESDAEPANFPNSMQDPSAVGDHESDAEPANYPDSMQDPSAVGDHESDAEPANFPNSMQDPSAVGDHESDAEPASFPDSMQQSAIPDGLDEQATGVPAELNYKRFSEPDSPEPVVPTSSAAGESFEKIDQVPTPIIASPPPATESDGDDGAVV